MDMIRQAMTHPRLRAAARVLLSPYFANGAMAALGLLLISGLVRLGLGPEAAAAASVGVIVCIPPDQAAPRQGKIWLLLPSALLGLPLFAAVQALHTAPLQLGLLLVAATFLAFLAGAWGKRGLPIVMSLMFAALFSMAMPRQASEASVLFNSACFALGAGAYLVWATVANAWLNPFYRMAMLANTLFSLVALMRLQARQLQPRDEPASGQPVIGAVLRQQALLADQLQAARDILLESPRTPRRQQLVAMLLLVMELRDHLLACELDLDAIRAQPGSASALPPLSCIMEDCASATEQVADALLRGDVPPAFPELAQPLAPWRKTAVPGREAAALPAALTPSLANRVANLSDDVLRLVDLGRGQAAPDLAAVRTAWRLFVSPTAWSWRPLASLWRWNAPSLRHAIRASLALGSAYALAQVLPWGTHDYWILLTIVVVLRGSLAQTLERRNHRVLGTLIGCLLSAALLSAHLLAGLLLLVLTLAQACAHAFAARRYLVTAVAATVLGLVQAHMLNAGTSPVFDVIERMADTLIGVGFAWLFSYFLPSWERHSLPSLLTRTLKAQARHAEVALGLGQLQAIDNAPEIEWRLARREAHDSLSALMQAIQRSLSEPRAVRPPLEPLERLLAYSYQLLAQLTAVKTMLLQHRDRIDLLPLQPPLAQAVEAIGTVLTQPGAASPVEAAWPLAEVPSFVAPLDDALEPWLLRRLQLATAVSGRVRAEADRVLSALGQSRS